jgi:hypothetical protein
MEGNYQRGVLMVWGMYMKLALNYGAEPALAR